MTGEENSFIGEEEEGLLETVFPGRWRLAVALEQVPVGVVQMHDMSDVGLVDDLQGDSAAQLGKSLDVGGVEGAPVDPPGGLEEAADRDLPAMVGLAARVPRPLRQRAQVAGDAGAVGEAAGGDPELHQRAA